MERRIAVGVECLSGYRAGVARVEIDLFEALVTLESEDEYLLVTDREIPGPSIAEDKNFVVAPLTSSPKDLMRRLP